MIPLRDALSLQSRSITMKPAGEKPTALHGNHARITWNNSLLPGMTVVTYLQPDGYYAAHDREYDLGIAVGYGKTREAALEELADLMDENGSAWK